MRLRFTTGSPFARVVRIVLSEKNIAYEKTEEITTTAAEERNRDAPTLQVPALSDGETSLWDSLVIIEYLMTRYPDSRTPVGFVPFASELLRRGHEIEDRLQLATLQTLGTSTATISQLKWSGVGLDNGFAAKNEERIGYLLDWFETQLIDTDEGFVQGVVSVQDICLAAWVDVHRQSSAWRGLAGRQAAKNPVTGRPDVQSPEFRRKPDLVVGTGCDRVLRRWHSAICIASRTRQNREMRPCLRTGCRNSSIFLSRPTGSNPCNGPTRCATRHVLKTRQSTAGTLRSMPSSWRNMPIAPSE